ADHRLADREERREPGLLGLLDVEQVVERRLGRLQAGRIGFAQAGGGVGFRLFDGAQAASLGSRAAWMSGAELLPLLSEAGRRCLMSGWGLRRPRSQPRPRRWPAPIRPR